MSDTSEDYDYSPFISEEYWQPVVAMKRNIKRLTKELNQERKALNDHFAKMACFFYLKQQDSDWTQKLAQLLNTWKMIQSG